jgi:inosine-uridine nucleoside N-ribohydrolase
VRPRIILDCDPGHDDAVAIVVAARHADLIGITTVGGNAPLERTTYNARVMRDLLDIDVPVHSGAAQPLVEPLVTGPAAHGESGLDGADLPPPHRPLDGIDAVGFIVEACRQTEGTWLVGVGPLTNVALALRAAPDLAGRLAGISIMGGGAFGNRTAVAEYNIWADPEAAAAVFSSGVPMVMAGLDLTHQLLATPARIEAVRHQPGPLAAVLADLFGFYSAGYRERDPSIGGAAVHDPCAVLALTHPELFTRRALHVAVETAGRLTRGMTVIDRRTSLDRPAANCDVLERIDDAAAWDVIVEAIGSDARPGTTSPAP